MRQQFGGWYWWLKMCQPCGGWYWWLKTTGIDHRHRWGSRGVSNCYWEQRTCGSNYCTCAGPVHISRSLWQDSPGNFPCQVKKFSARWKKSLPGEKILCQVINFSCQVKIPFLDILPWKKLLSEQLQMIDCHDCKPLNVNVNHHRLLGTVMLLHPTWLPLCVTSPWFLDYNAQMSADILITTSLITYCQWFLATLVVLGSIWLPLCLISHSTPIACQFLRQQTPGRCGNIQID